MWKKIKCIFTGNQLYIWNVKILGKRSIVSSNKNKPVLNNIMAKALGLYSRNYDFMNDPNSLVIYVVLDKVEVQYEYFNPKELFGVEKYYKTMVNNINDFFGKKVSKYFIHKDVTGR